MASSQSPSLDFSYHFTTVFLFIKSDITTTLVPISVFAIASAPLSSTDRIPHIVFWIFLHLMQCDVSNQSLNPEEDERNKPYRPIPSGRISVRSARLLRWTLVPLCCALSFSYSTSVLGASVAPSIFTGLYNEMYWNAHWLMRNVLNAAGLASFELGSTLIAGRDPSSLSGPAVLAICISAGIIATTIHTQDFKDEEGDRLIARKTIPITFPTVARTSVVVGLVSWSLFLAHIWDLSRYASLPLLLLGLAVGVRFLILRTVPDDQVTFYLYNVWLSIVHALPLVVMVTQKTSQVGEIRRLNGTKVQGVGG